MRGSGGGRAWHRGGRRWALLLAARGRVAGLRGAHRRHLRRGLRRGAGEARHLAPGQGSKPHGLRAAVHGPSQDGCRQGGEAPSTLGPLAPNWSRWQQRGRLGRKDEGDAGRQAAGLPRSLRRRWRGSQPAGAVSVQGRRQGRLRRPRARRPHGRGALGAAAAAPRGRRATGAGPLGLEASAPGVAAWQGLRPQSLAGCSRLGGAGPAPHAGAGPTGHGQDHRLGASPGPVGQGPADAAAASDVRQQHRGGQHRGRPASPRAEGGARRPPREGDLAPRGHHAGVDPEAATGAEGPSRGGGRGDRQGRGGGAGQGRGQGLRQGRRQQGRHRRGQAEARG
mmetsp:Transcript_75423/g.208100  ORF Transcript_75423/g.208100 Transcript_75423/m.208100 type:complete len:338 (-) Transcript_75423:1591-2604(-)